MKKFWTRIGVFIAVCILAAGIFTAGFGFAKKELSQYVNQQVDLKLEELSTELQAAAREQQTETAAQEETTVQEQTTEAQTEAVEANAQAETEEEQTAQAEFILPKVMYFQKTDEDQQYNIYYKNITAGEYAVFEVTAHEGIQMNNCYRVQTAELTELLYEANLRLFDANNEIVARQGLIMNFVEQQSEDEINLMCIGDSWTEIGEYCARIRDQVNNLNLLGVMERPGENLPRVGHGGWSLDSYMHRFMTDLDSPFLFPKGVSGSQYKGCVQTMKNIVTCDDGAYNTALYKKFARGWQDEGEYLWDENGYYKNPAVGDVMADASRPEGEQYIQWDGSQWVPMETQPEGYEFSFSKFMERFAVCFGGKTPTHISILSGANDFTYGCSEAEVNEWIQNYLEPMIQSIHEYNPEITVMIAFGQLGSDQDAFGSSFGAMISSRQYNTSMMTMAKTLIQYYDDDAHKAENIYLVPIYATLDTENGYSTETEQLNSYTDETVERHNDALHPSSEGMNQVGDSFLGVLEFTR